MARPGCRLRVRHKAGLGSTGERPPALFTPAVVGKSQLLASCWIRVFVSHGCGLKVTLSVPCDMELSLGQLTTWKLSASEKASEKSQRMV